MQKVTRMGVYGVAEKDNKLLLVIQNSGPYQGKFDFPGGGIEFGESSEDALRREFKEEVACEFNSLKLLDNLTTVVDVPKHNEKEAYLFYQIGMIYKVFGLKTLRQELGDLQFQWVDPINLAKEQCSSLLWKFLVNKKEYKPFFQMIDLTHAIDENIPFWDDSCGFHHNIKLDYSDCVGDVKFRLTEIKMDTGIGTHLDAPCHFIPNGMTVDQLPINQLIAPCVVIDVSKSAHERYSVSFQDIKDFEKQHGEIIKGQFVMIRTGWELFWNEPEKYRNNHLFPSVSKEAALYLLEKNIAGIGIDTLSPDRPEDGYLVHQALLGAGKYIVENAANLDKLPIVGSHILALPIKIKNAAEAPIRLIALIL